MTSRAKTVRMLLYDGSLDGMTNLSDSAWESGKMYTAPRESINKLISRTDCKKYGVYLLLSSRQVYVGQAVDLARRTRQHLADKAWWTQVVLMTTKDDSLNASDIDYFEARLIQLAVAAKTSDPDNQNRGNRQKVDEFRQNELDQYLDEALFLLDLIGVRVFGNQTEKRKIAPAPSILPEPAAVSSESAMAKPPLPDPSLGPCEFVKRAFVSLLESGYRFSDGQLRAFGSVEESRKYTTRNLPLFWILKEGEHRRDCDKRIRARYWKEEFASGEHRFLMYSQWYANPRKGATKEHFIRWYSSL